jgi:hypothetical protein
MQAGRYSAAVSDLSASARAHSLPETQWALADALRTSGRPASADSFESLLSAGGARKDPRILSLFLATRKRSLEEARSLANLSECVVVSVAYRQAPEQNFPTAIEEGFSAYRWLLDHASEVNGDPARIAVGGESAGGNMAAVVSLICRDHNVRLPLPQLLIYPVNDFTFDTPSYEENADIRALFKVTLSGSGLFSVT